LINRALLASVMQAVAIGRMGRDFVDALILTAVVQANIAPIMRDPELSRAYAAYPEPPPDELRRPVSVNAVAESLRIPYETARRRILRLAAAGACEVTAAGVIVPARELATPAHMAAMMQLWALMGRLHRQLAEAGVLDVLVPPGDHERWAPAGGEVPVRAVMRAASDFVLRFAANVEQVFGGLVEAIVWLQILLANTEAIGADEAGGPGESADDFVDDARRRPVRAREVAERLAAAPETVRRYVEHLLEQGLCIRTRRGLLVPAEVLARPAAVRVMRENVTDLQRLFTALARLGVLGAWEGQAAAAGAA
jgi:DNA-binding Lrp family transcriptional regulator